MVARVLLSTLLLAATPAYAQTFPKLTGRVVDQANLLTPAQEAELSGKSEALEKGTGRQFVIATVNTEIRDALSELSREGSGLARPGEDTDAP